MKNMKSHVDFWSFLAWLISFILGGSMGSMTFENPIGDFLKSKIVADQYVIQRFNQLESYYASTAVLAIKRDNKLTLTDITLKDINARANEFFGKRPESKELRGKTGPDLMKILRDWMDTTDYEAFKEDQERVFKQYGHDQDAFAKVPVVFNDKHPKHPNGVFLPVIVSLGSEEEKNSKSSERLIQIDYLDMSRFVLAVDEYKKKAGYPTSHLRQ